MTGQGALRFAQEQGFPVIYDTKQLVSQRAKNMKISYNDFASFVRYRMGKLLTSETGEDNGATTSSAALENRADKGKEIKGDDSDDTVSTDSSDDGTDIAKDTTGDESDDTGSTCSSDDSGYRTQIIMEEDSDNSALTAPSDKTALNVGSEARDVTKVDSSDTVSAVARDINGHFACAVSTGTYL